MAHNKKKQNLIAKQANEIDRVRAEIESMSGVKIRKSFLKTIATSNVNASVSQMQKKLKSLQNITPEKIAANIFEYTYNDNGKQVTKKNTAARIEYRYRKRHGLDDEVPTISIFDIVDDLITQFAQGYVIEHPGVHNHDSDLYGKRRVLDLELGVLVSNTWKAEKGKMSKELNTPGGVKNVTERLNSMYGYLDEAAPFESMQWKVFNKVASGVYHEMTNRTLPAKYSELNDSASPIGTPWEDGNVDEDEIDEG